MPIEDVPAGIAADGHGLVLFVPTIANPAAPTATELVAGTVVKLTYSLTGDGFRHEITENEITTNRYTLRDQLGLAGTVVHSLELQYVEGSPAQEALEAGTEGFIVHRLGLGNEVAPAASQTLDVLPIKAGLQRRVAPTANTELTRVQKQYITGPVHLDVAVVAGP